MRDVDRAGSVQVPISIRVDIWRQKSTAAAGVSVTGDQMRRSMTGSPNDPEKQYRSSSEWSATGVYIVYRY